MANTIQDDGPEKRFSAANQIGQSELTQAARCLLLRSIYGKLSSARRQKSSSQTLEQNASEWEWLRSDMKHFSIDRTQTHKPTGISETSCLH